MCLRVRLRSSGPTARTSCPHSPARVRGIFKRHMHAARLDDAAAWHFLGHEACLGGRCCIHGPVAALACSFPLRCLCCSSVQPHEYQHHHRLRHHPRVALPAVCDVRGQRQCTQLQGQLGPRARPGALPCILLHGVLLQRLHGCAVVCMTAGRRVVGVSICCLSLNTLLSLPAAPPVRAQCVQVCIGALTPPANGGLHIICRLMARLLAVPSFICTDDARKCSLHACAG